MLTASPAAVLPRSIPPRLLVRTGLLHVAAALLLIVSVPGAVASAAVVAPAAAMPAAAPDQATPPPATPPQAAPDAAFSPPSVPGLDDGPRLDRRPKPWYEQVVEVLIFALFLTLPAAFPVGFAAVALFMDSGCLRAVVTGLGWLSAVLYGLMIALMLIDMAGWPAGLLGLAFWGSTLTFGLLYFWGKRRVGRLSETDRLTWKRTLTGGAFIGTGVGSMLNVARSAGALFRGGGGSFGGGGAGGSFGSAQAATAPIASPGVASPGAVAKGTAVLGHASTSSTTAAAGIAAGSAGVLQHIRNRSRSWLRAIMAQLRRLQWYHGIGFLFTLLIFVPVGLGLTAILERPRVLLGIVGAVAMLRLFYLGVRLMDAFGIYFETSTSVNTGSRAQQVLPPVLLMLLLVGLIATPMLAAESQAPQWHLAIACALFIAVEGTLFFLPDTNHAVDNAPPFGGGSTSARW